MSGRVKHKSRDSDRSSSRHKKKKSRRNSSSASTDCVTDTGRKSQRTKRRNSSLNSPGSVDSSVDRRKMGGSSQQLLGEHPEFCSNRESQRENNKAKDSLSTTRKPDRHRSSGNSSSSRSLSSSSGSSGRSNSTSSSDSSYEKRKKRKKRKRKREKKMRREEKRQREEKRKIKKMKEKLQDPVKEIKRGIAETEQDRLLKDINVELADRARAMAPMTKEQWEKKQSIVRRVYDEETGRHRLIKGDGEVLEEIVSRDRHMEINKKATKGDGEFFQSRFRVNK